MARPVHEITVTIRGSSYALRTDEDNTRLHTLARYVDDTMNVLDPKQALPPNKLSVLASLTLAGELFDERENGGGLQMDLRDRVERMHGILDGVLNET